MKIVDQSWKFEHYCNGELLLKTIEKAGRTCYKSEDKITSDSAKEFVGRMLKSGHHAMIEHAVPPPVRVITDRGVTHEIVRHRLFSYAQESTRYCNYTLGKYGSELTVIRPLWFYGDYSEHNTDKWSEAYKTWIYSMEETEDAYIRLIKLGQSPQEARSVLPNSLKTEIIITGNVREWRHFFTLRCSKAAHPQMRELARDMLEGFRFVIPVLFDDIEY